MSLTGPDFLLPLEREIPDIAALDDFCLEFAAALVARGTPLIVCLTGEMGAGKTTLVATLVDHLGGAGGASPTYALHHRYELAAGRHMDHWDLYRVADESELDGAGFWEMLEFESDLWIVEWPDRVPAGYWPHGREIWNLRLEKTASGGRLLKIQRGL